MELEFFMDISPNWWIKVRKDKKYLNEYIFKKFQEDYYPRVINHNRNEIDLEKSGATIKKDIMDSLKLGKFEYEFLPEDENMKESYSISNGNIQFQPRRIKINSRLWIKITI